MSDYPHPWPNTVQGAVSLTFDDGTDDQLRNAVPALTERELTGTFYLPARDQGWREQLERWVSAQSQGHELGNHSASHRCSENFQPGRGPYGLESMSLADIEEDLRSAEERLDTVFGRRPRSFAYPCYMSDIGRGVERRSYIPVVARLFVAGRGGGEYGFFNHPYHIDLAHVHAQTCQQFTAPHMIGLCERAAAQGRWCVLCFHGLTTGRLGTPLGEFTELLDHLVAHRERLWTAPVVTVAQHLIERRAAAGVG